jgi:signal transduction histidine kinase
MPPRPGVQRPPLSWDLTLLSHEMRLSGAGADWNLISRKMASHSSSIRLRWPLIVLMVSIGLTALAAFDAQRTVRGQNAVVERAIKEFSSFAAWSYSEHLKQQLGSAAVEVVGAVNHGEHMHTNPRVPNAHELVHYLPTDIRCDCHRTNAGPIPATFFAFKLGTRDVDIAQNLYAEPTEGWRVDPMEGHTEMNTDRPDPASSWVADTLTAQTRQGGRDEHGYGMVIARHDNGIVPIIYTLMPTAWGDTMVYGAEYTPEAFGSIFTRVLDGSGLLPQTFTKGATNRNVVAIRVVDPAGERIFESAPGVNSQTFTQLALGPVYGGLAIRAMIRPQQASSLIIGGVPRSRLPFLLGLLALAAMMSVVAVAQIRRETEIAGMRADFVSSISHELRTPLAQIKLYLETIRSGRAPKPEQRDWSLAHIDRETTRLGNLVENVLRFSRLGRNDGLPSEPIDFATEIERIVDEFRPLAASRKSQIEVTTSAHPLVRIKPEGIRHVVVNLLDNAVKYGPVGQTVSVEISEKDGDAIVAVTDQGSGVPARDRETIWRAFARAKTETGAAGSGIGLTIVRDVALQNGGKAWVEGTESQGARFVVSFPADGRIEPSPTADIEASEGVVVGS